MPLTIRKAKINDLLKTFEWANEKEVITNSIVRSKKVTIKEHSTWFKKYITSVSSTIFIVCLNNEKIGLVRIDLKEKEFFISYLIDKKKRNRGFGYRMLDKIIKKYKNKKKIFKARVKQDNLASNSIFIKLGFKIKYTNQNKNIFLYRLET
jgi:RimJ/RimL family protein N-acetyltransferase